MKYVIDSSIAARWCLTNPDFAKAHNLRIDFHMGISELLAPDIFPPDCAELFVKAERKGDIPPGDAAIGVDDLLLVGVPLRPSFPLLKRAAAISLTTRLTVFASLYVACAERENCELLTADQKLIRKIRKQFSFVTDFATLR